MTDTRHVRSDDSPPAPTPRKYAWLSLTECGRLVISRSQRRDAELETQIPREVVLQHLHSMPGPAVWFTKNDQSFVALLHCLDDYRFFPNDAIGE